MIYELHTDNLTKRFGSRKVLRNISFSLKTGESLAILGKNGSGKTTLLRILAGLTQLSRGVVTFSKDSQKMSQVEIKQHLSYVGPELTLYDALTAAENLKFFATLRGISIGKALIMSILETVGLGGRGDDFYRAYSSGMKQRLKYAVALLNDPAYLLLDEPTSNLDNEGKEIVRQIMSRQRENGILIIATNEKEEYGFAEQSYRLNG
jgi:heme exporter protein A